MKRRVIPLHDGRENSAVVPVLTAGDVTELQGSAIEEDNAYSCGGQFAVKQNKDGEVFISPLYGNVFLVSGGGDQFYQGRTIPLKLYTGALIKMGAVTVEVQELDTTERIGNISTESELWALKNTIKTHRNDDKNCYICFEHVEDERILCKCASCVHISCLRKWLTESKRSSCPICAAQMKPSIVFNGPYITLSVRRRTKGIQWHGPRVFSFPIDPNNAILLGRDPEVCDICLYDPSVSNKHAYFRLKKDGLYIEDLYSPGGTFVLMAGDHVLSPSSPPVIVLPNKNMCLSLEIRRTGLLDRIKHKLSR